MLRIHGDRHSLLAALAAQWADQQLLIPAALKPVVRMGQETARCCSCASSRWRRRVCTSRQRSSTSSPSAR